MKLLNRITLAFFLTILLPCISLAALLSPLPKMQFFDSNGDPLVGGKLYTYAAGTTTPLATYPSSSQATPNANPIVTNARGELDCWLLPKKYKFILTTSAGDVIWSVDNINTAQSQIVADIATLRTTTVDSTLQADVQGYTTINDGGQGRFYWNPTSTTADNGGTIIKVATVTTGRWIRDVFGPVSAKWFGEVGDTATDNSAARARFYAYCQSADMVCYYPPGTYYSSTKTSINDDITLTGEPGLSILKGVDGATATQVILELQDDIDVKISGLKFITSNYPIYGVNETTKLKSLQVDKCEFSGTRHAIGLVDTRDSDDPTGTPISAGVNRLEVTNSDFVGVVNPVAAGVLSAAIEVTARNIDSALISGNTAINGTKRWLWLGNNFVPPVTPVYTKYTITDNTIKTQTSADASETQAILVYGERAIIAHNQIEDVYNSTNEDCEGIYSKARNSEIHDNILKNVLSTVEGGAITAKTIDDEDGYAVIHHNQIINTITVPASTLPTIGIMLQTGGIVSENTIQNIGLQGIYAASYGRRMEFKDNSITSVGTTVVPATQTLSAGIYVLMDKTQTSYAAGSTEDKVQEVIVRRNNFNAIYNAAVYVKIADTSESMRPTVVSDNNIYNITGDGYGVYFWSAGATPAPVPHLMVSNNNFHTLTNLVKLEGTQASAYKTKVSIWGNLVTTIALTGGAGPYFVNPVRGKINYGKNYGEFITENSGAVTIAAGDLESAAISTGLVDVAFTGMVLTPDQIQVVPSALGAVTHWWIEIVSSNTGTFKIVVDQVPGGSGAVFSWRAARNKEMEKS